MVVDIHRNVLTGQGTDSLVRLHVLFLVLELMST